MNKETIKAAREALSSMDDYARINTGVDAHGPRGVLEAFINAVEATRSPAIAVGPMGMTYGTKVYVTPPPSLEVRDVVHARVQQWERACREIIDLCVAPDMHKNARELLDRAVTEALRALP